VGRRASALHVLVLSQWLEQASAFATVEELEYWSGAPRDLIGSQLSSDFLSKPDEESFWAADVAEPIRVLELNYFANEPGTASLKTCQHAIDVIDRKHDA
jgi:hypothetical protein